MGNRLVHKFFVEGNQISENIIKINGEDRKHISNVLRMKQGEKILVSNKNTSKTYECDIVTIDKENVICSINKENDNIIEPKVKVDLFQGIPKSDKMEYIIQKSIELGVNRIIPVNMKYCIAKIKDEEKKNVRWTKIAESAAKQSKRNIIPIIEKSIDIEEVYKLISNYDLTLVAYENEDNITIKGILKNKEKNIDTIAIIIGPEGGISENEIENLKDNGANIVSLGKRILRTETASLAVLSMIMYEYDM